MGHYDDDDEIWDAVLRSERRELEKRTKILAEIESRQAACSHRHEDGNNAVEDMWLYSVCRICGYHW